MRTSHKISTNTALGYFVKFKSVLIQAFKDNIFQVDISNKLEAIKKEETQKEFLTLEEVNILVKTECSIPILKQVALFSALTGLRVSDIKKLKWSEVVEMKPNEYCIRFQQQKTKGMETLPISQQTMELMGTHQNDDTLVFKGFIHSAYTNKFLKQWVINAGINKKITFHCFRHTFATLQLTHGTDIYTVSKMLGHKNVTTTQVYAKIIDEKKREAMNRITLDL